MLGGKGIQAGDIVFNIGADASELQKKLAEAAKGVQGAISKVKPAITDLGLKMSAAGAAIVGGLGVAVKKAADFQSAMSEVKTLGVEDAEALGDAIKDVSGTFGTDLIGSVNAAYQAISAGASEYEAPLVLQESAMAAVAGVSDLSTAVELGMGVNNAFGRSMDDIGTTFDEAFVAVKAGVTTFGELAASVGRVAPAFAAAKVGSDEMFASVAALTKGGMETSQAVTRMGAVMQSFIKPTSEATKMAKELGIEFNVNTLETHGLAGALDMVKEATGGNIDSLGKLFSSQEALMAVLALTGNQAEDFTTILGQMKDGAGATKEAFDKFIEDNPAYAFQILKAQVNVLAVEIGEALLPTLFELMEQVKPMVENLIAWIKANPELTATITKWVAAIGAALAVLGPLFLAIGWIIGGVSSLITLVSSLGTVWTAITTVFGVVVTAIGWVISAIGSIGTVIGLVATPIGWIIAAIAGIAAAATAVWYYWEPIKDFFKGLWDDVLLIFWWVGENLEKWFLWVWDWIKKILDPLGIISGTFNAIGGMIPGFADGGVMSRGGLALVGERGPELVQLPAGARVFSNEQSQGMMGGVNFNAPLVQAQSINASNPADVDALSRTLGNAVVRAIKGSGFQIGGL